MREERIDKIITKEKPEKKRRHYYLSYTILFVLIGSVMTGVFWLGERSFVWSKDGAAQHYPTLVYIHHFLVELVKNFLHGKWELPMVDFTIGEGMDVLTTLNYYGFGDPLTLTALFCPERYLEILYGVLIFVRLYLTGIFFSLFCFSKGKEQRVTVLAGALAYVFCGYALYASVRHPFFVNGMMYLPLYLLGIERILQKKKYGLFSVVVALSLISNFYFGYMNTVMMALYVLLWMIPEKSLTWKQKGSSLLKMIGSYLCGVALSAAIMVPMVMAYLTCSRGGEGGYSASLLFYPKDFYRDFVLAYAVPATDIGEWTNLSFSVLCLPAVISLFLHRARSKKEKQSIWKLRIGYLLLTAMMLIPLAGKVMNGFGYVSNRWNYAYAMLNAYMIVCMIPVILRYLKPHIKNWEGSRFRVSLAICLFMTGNLIFNVVTMYSSEETDYLDEFDRAGAVQATAQDSPVQAVSELKSSKEKEFYRVEQPWIIGNQSLMMGYHGHNWYFSIAPEWYFDFYNSIQLNTMERTYSLRGLDGRTVLNELTATKYYMTDNQKDGMIPYGYHLKKAVKDKEGDTNYIYENEYFLPLGYTVSAWIREEDYQLLSPIEKQEALMQSVVLQENEEEKVSMLSSEAAGLNMDVEQEFCTVASCSGLTWENNQLNVKEKNATITLTFQGKANCETYLWFNEFQVIRSGKQYQTGTVESGDTVNHFVLMNPQKSAWYDEPNQTINLGYSREPRTSCTITFPEKGVYSLDDFVVVYESMDNYEAKVDMLKADTLENVQVETNRIEGDITLSKTKLLQIAVPYSAGWNAYVNGKEADILRSNEMYMALELPAGDAHVVFEYTTPYLKAGIVISLLGLVVLGVVIWKGKKRGEE